MKPKKSTLSSTEKALKILLAFAPENREMGTLELSEKLGLHKSTVSRLLRTLTDHGFLQQNLDNKRYLLGRSAARIGNAVIKSLDNAIINIAQPYLADLCKKTGESVALEILSGSDIILACQEEGQEHIRFSFKLGEAVPVNVAAGAKAILSFSDPERVEKYLHKKFIRYNERTITSKVKYRQHLKEIKKTGIAYDRGERFEDSYAAATPIFNHRGVPIAAVVVAGPAFRLTPDYLADMVAPLKKTAREISQSLLY